MISEAYVTIVLPGDTLPTVAGRLTIEQQGRDIQASFVYGRRYCALPNALAIDPIRLPIDPDREYRAPGLWGVLGVFRDASPDYWGRMVIEHEAKVAELPEMEYLIRSGNTRIGALGFQNSLEESSTEEQPVGLLSLPQLIEASRKLEANIPIEEELLRLLRQGTSIGGARPKATVVEDGVYWLAKFPSKDDRMDIPVLEYATLKLAEKSGIRIPECKLIDLGNNIHVLLIRRFDRQKNPTGEGWLRFHFMSGLTLLGLNEFENARGGYPNLVDVLRRLSIRPQEDAKEMFRRMVFNELISNDDDHLRNHAMLRTNQGWCLSPAYDLVPHPQIGFDRFQSIIVGKQGRVASLNNALSEARRFGLIHHAAVKIVDDVMGIIEKWQQVYLQHGVSAKDIEMVKSAFLPESVIQHYSG